VDSDGGMMSAHNFAIRRASRIELKRNRVEWSTPDGQSGVTLYFKRDGLRLQFLAWLLYELEMVTVFHKDHNSNDLQNKPAIERKGVATASTPLQAVSVGGKRLNVGVTTTCGIFRNPSTCLE